MVTKKRNITYKGLAIIIIIAIAPFNRYLLSGRGMIYWALLLGIGLFALSILRFNRSMLTLHLDDTNIVRVGIIGINIILTVSVLFSPYANPLTLNTSKIQLCAVILFSYILNLKEEKIVALMSFIGSIILLYMYFYSSSTRGYIRTYIELMEGVYLDPNMVATAFFIPCAYAASILTSKKKLILKCAMAIFVGFWLYTSFMGGSRSGLLAGIVGIVAYFLAKYRVSAKTIIYAIIGALFVAFVFSIIKGSLSADILERMTLGAVLESSGSGRTDIWSSHVDMFLSNNFFRILFGFGRESCANVAGISAHNIIIDYMWDLGIMGLMLYVVVMILIIRYCIASGDAISISILSATVVWSFTISASNQLIYWVLLYYAFMRAHNYRKKTQWGR